MTGLPKKYAKMGFKKGWAKFKASKGKSTSRVKNKIKTRSRMAKVRKYGKKQSILGRLNNPLFGAAGVVTYESLISPMIPVQGIAKDMLELVAGLWMSKKQGILGATGKSLLVINSYQLISNIAKPMLENLNLTGNNNENNYFNY